MSPRKVHVLRPYPGGRTFCGRDPRKVKTAPPRVAHVRAMPPVARRRGRMAGGVGGWAGGPRLAEIPRLRR